MPPTLDGVFRQLLREVVREVVREEVASALTPRPVLSPEQPVAPPTYLTTGEAAAAAGVSEKTVRRWARTGKLRAQSAGRLLRIEPAELDRFLATGGGSGDHKLVDVDAIAAGILRRRRR